MFPTKMNSEVKFGQPRFEELGVFESKIEMQLAVRVYSLNLNIFKCPKTNKITAY